MQKESIGALSAGWHHRALPLPARPEVQRRRDDLQMLGPPGLRTVNYGKKCGHINNLGPKKVKLRPLQLFPQPTGHLLPELMALGPH